MPEGHTIHRIARDHHHWFAGQKLSLSSPQGRFSDEAQQLDGRELQAVSAHGKHLFYHWGRQLITHIHLGLYGKFRAYRGVPPTPRGAVRVRMIGFERAFDLVGPTRCELLDQKQLTLLQSRLGEDPLRTDASPEKVWKKLQKSRSAIGSLLLNQSVIAGVGNVYRAEILNLLGIPPQLPANAMTRKMFDDLWCLTCRLLRIGVRYNRIITAGLDEQGRVPRYLKAAERLNVYKRAFCQQCDAPVQTLLLANRKMYVCPNCQKP
jgi:endonuclease-8